MFNLYNAQNGERIGEISEEQITFLRSQLEEEDSSDQDYYINPITIDLLESKGGSGDLIALLRRALGDKEDMDIRWE